MLEWLNNALIGGLVGSIIGFLSTYFLQNRQWKRESNLRNIERIYLPLYQEVRTNISLLDKPYVTDLNLHCDEWAKISQQGLALLIEPKDLQDNLRKFYDEKLIEYNKTPEKGIEAMAAYMKYRIGHPEESEFAEVHKELLDLSTSIERELSKKIEKSKK